MKTDDVRPIEILPFSPQQAGEPELREYHALANEVLAEQDPTAPAFGYEDYVAALRDPMTFRGPRRIWVARREGRIVGCVELTFFQHENTRQALASVRVVSVARRRGIGNRLLGACIDALRAQGRETLVGFGIEADSGGMAWARNLGFAVTQRKAWQVLRLTECDRSLWEAPLPSGFRIERWIDAAPEAIVSSFARARTAILDAPSGMTSAELPDWTVERVRLREAELRAIGEEHRFVVAVHEGTGEVAGLTEIALDGHEPDICFQEDTAVLRPFRGVGLGRALKGEMARWLNADRPFVREIWTTVAADNGHMIRLNTQLGYVTDKIVHTVEAGVDELEPRMRALTCAV